MSILTLDNYIGSAKQYVQWVKTASRTSVANGWFSVFDLAGAPGAGTLAGTSAGTGVVPDDTVAGYPLLNAFGGGATGYLSKVNFASTVACRIAIFDRLFVAGPQPFNAAVTLSGPPSYSARVPNTDYKGLQIWAETVTAETGNQTWNVGYTNDVGTAGQTTGAVGIAAAPTVGRCFQLPLQAGDNGVQSIQTITGGTATVGTANIMVLRPLWTGRIIVANSGDVHDMLRTGLPQVPATTALYVLINADSTATGVPEMRIEVANA